MQRVDHALEMLCGRMGNTLTHSKRQTQNGYVWTITLTDCGGLLGLLPGELPYDKHHWNRCCAQHGFTPSDRLRLFRCPRSFRTFQLVSLSAKSPKWPVIALGSQGGRYKFQTGDVGLQPATPAVVRSGNAAEAAAAQHVKAEPVAEAKAQQQQEVKTEPEMDCVDEPDRAPSDAKEAASDSDSDIPLRQLQAKRKAKRSRAEEPEPVIDLSVSDDEAPQKKQTLQLPREAQCGRPTYLYQLALL
ncbi:hypothetical protein MMC14_010717 [Varicellaria rhodocarpa]|nr:hypothetical protein [Varicellaria rhodocarpa]